MQDTCIQDTLSSRALGLAAARAKVSCIQARYHYSRAHSVARPSARATIEYLVYKNILRSYINFSNSLLNIFITRYPIVARAVGRESARAKVSCIQLNIGSVEIGR